ncbi:hypothetical protein C0Q70_19460 [Pomacea canaliculata]|uniref:Uncharacterized protein n=1 Tax=Pomacea canaliculata TaxID=400727 RepID=A0A2T7NJF4_POMCA|nr:hypothetical protein C0Q70_19460 [Pomacea canaliculata]
MNNEKEYKALLQANYKWYQNRVHRNIDVGAGEGTSAGPVNVPATTRTTVTTRAQAAAQRGGIANRRQPPDHPGEGPSSGQGRPPTTGPPTTQPSVLEQAQNGHGPYRPTAEDQPGPSWAASDPELEHEQFLPPVLAQVPAPGPANPAVQSNNIRPGCCYISYCLNLLQPAEANELEALMVQEAAKVVRTLAGLHEMSNRRTSPHFKIRNAGNVANKKAVDVRKATSVRKGTINKNAVDGKSNALGRVGAGRVFTRWHQIRKGSKKENRKKGTEKEMLVLAKAHLRAGDTDLHLPTTRPPGRRPIVWPGPTTYHRPTDHPTICARAGPERTRTHYHIRRRHFQPTRHRHRSSPDHQQPSVLEQAEEQPGPSRRAPVLEEQQPGPSWAGNQAPELAQLREKEHQPGQPRDLLQCSQHLFDLQQGAFTYYYRRVHPYRPRRMPRPTDPANPGQSCRRGGTRCRTVVIGLYNGQMYIFLQASITLSFGRPQERRRRRRLTKRRLDQQRRRRLRKIKEKKDRLKMQRWRQRRQLQQQQRRQLLHLQQAQPALTGRWSSKFLPSNERHVDEAALIQARRNSMPTVTNNLLAVPTGGGGGEGGEPRETRLRRVRSFKTTSKGVVVNRGDSFKKKSTHSLMSTGSEIKDGDRNSRARSSSNNNSALDLGSSSPTSPAYFRVNMMGAAGVGKTSLAQQFLTSDHDGDEVASRNVSRYVSRDVSSLNLPYPASITVSSGRPQKRRRFSITAAYTHTVLGACQERQTLQEGRDRQVSHRFRTNVNNVVVWKTAVVEVPVVVEIPEEVNPHEVLIPPPLPAAGEGTASMQPPPADRSQITPDRRSVDVDVASLPAEAAQRTRPGLAYIHFLMSLLPAEEAAMLEAEAVLLVRKRVVAIWPSTVSNKVINVDALSGSIKRINVRLEHVTTTPDWWAKSKLMSQFADTPDCKSCKLSRCRNCTLLYILHFVFAGLQWIVDPV